MSENDKQALMNNTAVIESKIQILPKVVGESIVTITNYDSIKDWIYKDLRYVEKQGFIGQFVARQLEGNLQDISDDFSIQDREIVLWLGIKVNINASTTWYSLGNFLVSKPESNEVNDNTKYEALDYTIKFNVQFNGDYKDSEYTSSFNEIVASGQSVTALWLAEYTCKQCGVVLGQDDFLNYDFEIDSNQFDSEDTCRDVIKAISKLAYTWARIDWDNKLYFDFIPQTTSSITIDNDHYYSLKTQKKQYGEVNRVLIGTSAITGDNSYIEDAQSIADNGLTEIDIYDNPLTYTQELRDSVIASGNVLFGLQYNVVDMETVGHAWLKGNELIEVTNMENVPLYTYAFDRTIKYNGHIKTQLTSYANTDIESTYLKDNDVYSNLKKTRVELNKAEQYFKVEIENIDNKYSTELDVLNSVTSYPTSSDTSTRNYPIHITNAGAFNLEHEILQGKTVQNGTPSSTNPVAITNIEGNIVTTVDNGITGADHKVNVVTHTLQSQFVGSIGVTKDTFDCSTGELVKSIGRYTFDGTENWQLNTTTSDYISFYLEGTTLEPLTIIPYNNLQGTDVRGICNYFPVVVGIDTTSENIGFIQNGQDTKVYLNILKSTLSTPNVDGLKLWLRTNYVDTTKERVVLQFISSQVSTLYLQYNSALLFEGVNDITLSASILPDRVDIEYLTTASLNGKYATFNQLMVNKNSINAVLKETKTLASDLSQFADQTDSRFITVTQGIETSMTNAQVGIDFKQEVEDNGVKIVDTQTGIRLDESGMSVEKFEGGVSLGTKTLVDHTGMTVYDTTSASSSPLLQVNTSGVNCENITTRTYLNIGGRSRFENYLNGTGCYFIGDDNNV